MANQERNGGRNVAVPDENRPSWRPQDEQGQRNRRNMNEEDDRYDDDLGHRTTTQHTADGAFLKFPSDRCNGACLHGKCG